MRLLKVLLALLVLGFVGLTGYAYLGDMNAQPVEIRQPVPLDLGASPTAGAATVTTQDAPAPSAGENTPSAEEPEDGAAGGLD